MAKKKGSGLGALFGAAAIAAAAKIISDLEKKAKTDGKDIIDVAKEKAADIVEDVKSGKAVEGAKELGKKAGDSINNFAEDVKSGKVAEDIKSGKIVEDAKAKINETVEKVKSDDFKNDVNNFASNLKDGVVDIFDGKDEPAEEVVEEKSEDTQA